MTAKEKAKRIYDKYKEILNIRNDMRPGANPFAKECAIYLVDEILESCVDEYDIQLDAWPTPYWNEVKQELENM